LIAEGAASVGTPSRPAERTVLNEVVRCWWTMADGGRAPPRPPADLVVEPRTIGPIDLVVEPRPIGPIGRSAKRYHNAAELKASFDDWVKRQYGDRYDASAINR